MAALGSTCDNLGGSGCLRWLGDERWSIVVIRWASMCAGSGGIGDGVSIDGDGLDDVRSGGFGPIFNVTPPWEWCLWAVVSSINIALPLHWLGGVWNVTLCLASKLKGGWWWGRNREEWSKLICLVRQVFFLLLLLVYLIRLDYNGRPSDLSIYSVLNESHSFGLASAWVRAALLLGISRLGLYGPHPPEYTNDAIQYFIGIQNASS